MGTWAQSLARLSRQPRCAVGARVSITFRPRRFTGFGGSAAGLALAKRTKVEGYSRARTGGPSLRVVQISSPADVRKTPQPFLAGHDRYLKAVHNFVRWVRAEWEGGSDTVLCRILLFGQPGAAKTLFSRVLVHLLNADGIECGKVTVPCHQLIGRNEEVDDIVQQLNDVDRFVNQGDQLKIVVLDELDVLAQQRAEEQRLVDLTGWAMSFLERRATKTRSIVVGLTNNPNNVDDAVLDRFDCSLYFELPDTSIVQAILENAKVADAREIAEKLCSRLEKMGGGRFSGRSLAKAASIASARRVSGGGSPAKSLDELMFPYLTIQSSGSIAGYESRNSFRIAQSHSFLDQWG